MNTNDLLLRWSHMSLEQIEAEIASSDDLDAARELLGDQVVADIAARASAMDPAAKGVLEAVPDFGLFGPAQTRIPEGVVLLPGMMGSQLSSIRGVTSLMWINPLVFTAGQGRYLALGPDGVHDNCVEIEMVPVAMAPFVYVMLGLALQRQADLYEFPYDWRRTVESSADHLHNSLERWANGTDRKFILVGHSMGGNVARAYLAKYPRDAEKRVKQLVMIGSPLMGTVTALQTLFTGNDIMERVNSLNANNQIASVVRSMPGLYNLLPPPPDLFPSGTDYVANWNVYDAREWSIDGIRQDYLDGTRALYQLLARSDPQIPQVQIAGCNLRTLFNLEFDFGALDTLARAARKIFTPNLVFYDEGETSGDGTVPLWSARQKGIETFYIREEHVPLAKNGEVIKAVNCLIRGDPCPLPKTIPAARQILGIHYGVEGGENSKGLETAGPEGMDFAILGGSAAAAKDDSPEAFVQRLRSGNANQKDLMSLQFAI
jgi:pimeloyl-ACP methyl ester carboxylesterase